MLVRDWMSRRVVTVDALSSMKAAIKLMMDCRVKLLPVTVKAKLVGVVTDGDLKRAAPSDVAVFDTQQILHHLSRVQVRNIMSGEPVTVPPDFTIEEAALVMLQRRIPGCPVINRNGRLVGVITRDDIFKAMISLSGLNRKGVQFGFVLDDVPGSIQSVTDLIRKYGARLVSILSTYEGADRGKRFAYIRAFDLDRSDLQQLIEELKDTAELLYVVDLRENRREVYDGRPDEEPEDELCHPSETAADDCG